MKTKRSSSSIAAVTSVDVVRGQMVPKMRLVVTQNEPGHEFVAGHDLTETEALNLAMACLEHVSTLKRLREEKKFALTEKQKADVRAKIRGQKEV